MRFQRGRAAKNCPSEDLTFPPVGLDLRISRAGAMPFQLRRSVLNLAKRNMSRDESAALTLILLGSLAMLTTKMRLSPSGSVPLIVSCGIRQETRGPRVQRYLRIRNSENRPEILVPDLNNNLVAIAGYKPGPPFCQALRNLESLGFRSSHVGQLNPTWIFVRSEVAPDIDIVPWHG
jgi:hypothetical protein